MDHSRRDCCQITSHTDFFSKIAHDVSTGWLVTTCEGDMQAWIQKLIGKQGRKTALRVHPLLAHTTSGQAKTTWVDQSWLGLWWLAKGTSPWAVVFEGRICSWFWAKRNKTRHTFPWLLCVCVFVCVGAFLFLSAQLCSGHLEFVTFVGYMIWLWSLYFLIISWVIGKAVLCERREEYSSR